MLRNSLIPKTRGPHQITVVTDFLFSSGISLSFHLQHCLCFFSVLSLSSFSYFSLSLSIFISVSSHLQLCLFSCRSLSLVFRVPLKCMLWLRTLLRSWSVCVWVCCRCLVGVCWCGVLLMSGVCGCVGVWCGTLKNSRVYIQNAPRVYRYHVHMCENVHTGVVLNVHTVPPFPLPPQHTYSNTPQFSTAQHNTAKHNTTQNTPHRSKEKREEGRREHTQRGHNTPHFTTLPSKPGQHWLPSHWLLVRD